MQMPPPDQSSTTGTPPRSSRAQAATARKATLPGSPPSTDDTPRFLRFDDFDVQLVSIEFDLIALALWITFAWALQRYVGAFTLEPLTMLRLLLVLAVTIALVPISFYLIRDIEDFAAIFFRRRSRAETRQSERDLGIMWLIRLLRIFAAATFGVALVLLGIYLSLGHANHLFGAFIAALATVLYFVTPYVVPDAEDELEADLGPVE